MGVATELFEKFGKDELLKLAEASSKKTAAEAAGAGAKTAAETAAKTAARDAADSKLKKSVVSKLLKRGAAAAGVLGNLAGGAAGLAGGLLNASGKGGNTLSGGIRNPGAVSPGGERLSPAQAPNAGGFAPPLTPEGIGDASSNVGIGLDEGVAGSGKHKLDTIIRLLRQILAVDQANMKNTVRGFSQLGASMTKMEQGMEDRQSFNQITSERNAGGSGRFGGMLGQIGRSGMGMTAKGLGAAAGIGSILAGLSMLLNPDSTPDKSPDKHPNKNSTKKPGKPMGKVEYGIGVGDAILNDVGFGAFSVGNAGVDLGTGLANAMTGDNIPTGYGDSINNPERYKKTNDDFDKLVGGSSKSAWGRVGAFVADIMTPYTVKYMANQTHDLHEARKKNAATNYKIAQEVDAYWRKYHHDHMAVIGANGASSAGGYRSHASNVGHQAGSSGNIQPASTNDPQANKILDAISRGESGGDYDAVLGKGKKGHAEKLAKILAKFGVSKITDLSIGQLIKAQGDFIRAFGGSASGKYQFVRRTLEDTIKQAGVPLTAKFSPHIQDMLAMQLLKNDGYKRFKAGKMSADEFQDKIAGTWASITNSAGIGVYNGDGMNQTSDRATAGVVAAIHGDAPPSLLPTPTASTDLASSTPSASGASSNKSDGNMTSVNHNQSTRNAVNVQVADNSATAPVGIVRHTQPGIA